MIITLTGPNDFARNAELKKIVNKFEKEHGDFGLEKIEAAEVELGRLLESVSSLPFLSARRMIVLSDPSHNKALSEKIEQLISSVADTTDMILTERKLDKRQSLYKNLRKSTDFREFNELDERGLSTWLVSEAKARGGEIRLSDAIYLVHRVGLSQLGLSNELDKLLAYESKITKQSINLLTEPLPQGSVFELLDTAFAGNRKKNSQTLHRPT